MNIQRKTLRIVCLASTLTVCGALVGAAPATQPDQFRGNLVDTLASAHFSRPFILSVDHYASSADLERLAAVLNAHGPYAARDELWKQTAGNLSVGGGIGYPIAAVMSQETPGGRKLRVILNRPLSFFEAEYSTRSSKYPFSVVELDLDAQGRGNGQLIAAVKMQAHGDELSFESLGTQPFRLLDVREGAR